MKKTLLFLLLVIAASMTALWFSFSAATLPVGKPPKFSLSDNNSPQGMTLTAISAGKMFSKAGLAYRGGDLNKEIVMSMGGVLIQHPKGNLLIDAGFASNIDEHFATTPAIMQRTSTYEAGTPIVQQLPKAGLSPKDLSAVILTHTHWDHVSGLADLPDVPVWVTKEELAFVNTDSELTKLARIIGIKNYQAIKFSQNDYLGFTKSYDVFNDQSVVIVPGAGHTPGALIVFVTLPNDDRYAFIGDLAWQKEGIDLPAEKPWLPRVLVEEDTEAVQALLVKMHHIQNQIPNMKVVPSHDQKAWTSLPTFR